jgi:hypothetical protein
MTVSHQHLAQRECLVGRGHHKHEGIGGQGPPTEGDARGGPTISPQSGHASSEGDVLVRARAHPVGEARMGGLAGGDGAEAKKMGERGVGAAPG